jgi:hypothetical protein
MHQILGRQAQLIHVQRRYAADHLRAIFAGKPLSLLAAIVTFLDQHADQIHIGGQAVHVLRHLVRPSGEHVAVAHG